MTRPRVMLLAAGRGERMRPLTDRIPKPLLEVGGKPLIVWHLERLAAQGLRDIVINLSWLGGRLREALGDGGRHGVRIHWIDEGPEPLETAGGIRNALPWLGASPFLVVNADVYTEVLFPTSLTPGRLAHLVLVPNPDQHPRGDFGLECGELRFTGAPRYTYSGIGLYSPALFQSLTPGRRPLRPVLDRALHGGWLQGSLWQGLWVDVGTPDRLQALDRRLA